MILRSLSAGQLRNLTSNDYACTVGELSRGTYVDKKHHVIFDDLTRDIRANGITSPLRVVNNLLVDGHHRAIIAMELGLEEVPVIYEGTICTS